MYEENDLFQESEDAIDQLLDLIGNIPQNVVTMLNIPKYAEAVRSISKIVKFVKEDFPDAKASVEFDGLTGTTLILTIITDGMNVCAVKDFCEALSVASTMDVVPLDDGKVQIGFTYRKIKVAVPPVSEKE